VFLLAATALNGCVSNGKKPTQAVKQECNLDGKLTQYIEENAAGQYAKILTDSTIAQILKIEIEKARFWVTSLPGVIPGAACLALTKELVLF